MRAAGDGSSQLRSTVLFRKHSYRHSKDGLPLGSLRVLSLSDLTFEFCP